MALAANFRGKAAGTRLPEDQSQGFRHDRPRRHGSKAGYTSGWLGSTPEGRRPQIRGFRAGGSLAVASSTPATQLLSPAKTLKLNHAESLGHPRAFLVSFAGNCGWFCLFGCNRRSRQISAVAAVALPIPQDGDNRA